MATGGRMVMRTEALLTLVQWFSPGFPVGAFGYSHGLEWEIESGAVTDAGAVQSWVADILAQGSGRSDAILLSCAWRADPAELDDLDDLARALAPSSERLAETEQRYEVLIERMRAASDSMDPVLAVFRDRVLFLKHNLNASAIASLDREKARIEGDVSQLIAEMEASIAAADAFISEMRGTG